MKLWKYKNYDEYVKVQTEGNLNKLKNVWARPVSYTHLTLPTNSGV